MRVPRVRFTVRQLMIAAALVAVLMAVGVGLQRRTSHLKRLSSWQSGEANRWELLLTESSVNGPLASAILDKVHWHDAIAARYERAARSPGYPSKPCPRHLRFPKYLPIWPPGTISAATPQHRRHGATAGL